MKPTRFEYDVVNKYLYMQNISYNPELKVLKREISTAWFYTYFDNLTIKDLTSLSGNISINFHAYSPQFPNGMWFVLYFKKGKIVYLEWFVYNDILTSQDIKNYTFKVET